MRRLFVDAHDAIRRSNGATRTGRLAVVDGPDVRPGLRRVYTTGPVTLRKIARPGIAGESLNFDVVLLSHDHHADNLDHLGLASLSRAQKVLTTHAGAERLGGNSVGLAPWERVEIPAQDGRVLGVMGTPARHRPEGGDRGPVIGFLLQFADAPDSAVYVSGDAVWYEALNQTHRPARIQRAVPFMGAAVFPKSGLHI